MRSITELRGIAAHDPCRPCFVVAGGASMAHYPAGFFDDGHKFVIGVNRAAALFRCDYTVWKEIPQRFGGESIVVARHPWGDITKPENTFGDFVFDHPANGLEKVNWPEDPNQLVVSFSTITSALHLAAYMGFRTILVAGHDCGSVDGMMNPPGYLPPNPNTSQNYAHWLTKIEPQTVEVRRKIAESYGAHVVSLNPFASLRLEGHTFKP